MNKCPIVFSAATTQLANVGFLTGGGRLGEAMRNLDWSATPVGTAAQWPASLRTAVNICLGSRNPIVLWWGHSTYTTFYNDACIDLFGPTRHPQSLGRSGPECWSDLWSGLGPLLDRVFATGEAVDARLTLVRDQGQPGDTACLALSCSAIRDEAGQVGGVFCIGSAASRLDYRRDAMLAELDRVNTVLFSQTGLDFRTPLTFLFRPLEEALREDMPEQCRDTLMLVQRNLLRLQKRMNRLLGFARIEASRLQTYLQLARQDRHTEPHPTPEIPMPPTSTIAMPSLWDRLAQTNPLLITAGGLTLATLIRAALTPLWGAGYTFITYCPAIMFSTLVGGWRHGLLATALSALLAFMLFLDTPLPIDQAVALLIFLTVNSLLMALSEMVVGVLRRTEAEAIAAQGSAEAARQELCARQHAEAALRASEERFRGLVEQAVDGIFVADEWGHYVDVNSAGARMLGYEREELLRLTIADVIAPEEAPRFPGEVARFADGGVVRSEWRFKRKDGSYFAGEVLGRRLNSGRLQAIVRDITERNEVAAVLRETETNLARTQASLGERQLYEEQLKASLGEKEVLLKEVHHRVKNNLQVISSLLNLQARQLSDPSAHAVLSESQSRVQSIALVHEKLYQSADLAHIDFSGYLDDLVRNLFYTYNAAARGIAHHLEAAGSVLAVDLAIPCGLIVNELVSNALQHAFPAGRPGTVSVALGEPAPGVLELAVADDGIGLPGDLEPEQYRAHSLGLDLVYTFAEQIDAKVEVQRQAGTSFRFRFRRGV